MVSRLNKALRKADFRKGKRLGKDDHIVQWPKPWIRGIYGQAQKSMPKFLTVREARVYIKQPGFRTKAITIATTLLDPIQYPKEDLAESDVVQVHYIKATPGKVGDYIDMEVELFERLHQARVDKGQLKFWAFLSRDFPGGTERDWDFVTIQVFKDAESMDKPWPSELADEVLSKEELDSFPKAGELRRIYREEYWRPIAFAASKEE